MPEVIISGSGTQFPLIINGDGSINIANGTVGSLIVTSAPFAFRTKHDFAGSNFVIFIGEVLPGTSTGSPGWRIQKRNYNGQNRFTGFDWASGNSNLDKVYNDRVGAPFGPL